MAATVNEVYGLQAGMDFASARRAVMQQQWQPALSPDATDGPMEHNLRLQRFMEVESCAMDRGICLFLYQRAGRHLELQTMGEDPRRLTLQSWHTF